MYCYYHQPRGGVEQLEELITTNIPNIEKLERINLKFG